MDINLLPLEVLQEILSYLSYRELKVASLVCRHWHQASETFIVRNGMLCVNKDFDVLRKSSILRNYQAIYIARMDDWQLLQAAFSECVQRVPYVRNLYLESIIPGHFNWFCQAYRDWMKTLESLEILLKDDTPELHLLGEQKDVILELPNLKKLRWTEGMTGFGQKIVTINGPKLENVYFEDYYFCKSRKSYLRITHCEQIKHIDGTFYKKHFDDLFEGITFHVVNLILSVRYGNGDVSCLSNMHQLRYLSLDIGNGTRHLLQELEAMQNSKLEYLSICEHCFDSDDRGTLNLQQIFGNFKNLKTLYLFGIDLTANGEIQADQLVLLKLISVTCSRSIELNAPKLETLAIPVEILGKLHLNRNEQLSHIYLDLKFSNLKEAFEQIVHPFINERKHITLALMRHFDAEVLDDVINDRAVESVDHLILFNMDVGITFFQLLAGWKSLKHLKLINCSINCSEMPFDVVRLPGVERMIIDRVKLIGTSRTDFPILLDSGANQELVGEWAGSLFFSTKHYDEKPNSSFYRIFHCHFILAIVLLSFCVLISDGQVISLGTCPHMPVVPKFNAGAFLGLWYEQEKYPNLFQVGGKCNTAVYSMKNDGTLSIMNRHENKISGIETAERGYGRFMYPGKLKVRFPQPWKGDAPYFIIGTDYINYAVVVTCSEYGLVNGKIAWILTRHRYPSQKIMKKAYAEMEHANLSVVLLKKTDHTHCDPVRPPLDNFIGRKKEDK